MSGVGAGGIGAPPSVAVAEGTPPPHPPQLSQLLQLLQRKIFNRPRPQQLLQRLLQHRFLQQEVLQPQDGFTLQPQDGLALQPQDGLQELQLLQHRLGIMHRKCANKSQPQELRLQQDVLHPQDGLTLHPQDGFTATPHDGLQELQRDLQHLGLQHRDLQQDFRAHPHDGATLASQPHFVSQPQPLTPSMRSKSSKPKLWLHKLTVTTRAPIRLVNFIE